MIDPVELESMRDALQRAIFSGTRRVQFSDGRMVEYGSTPDMQNALASLNIELAKASSSVPSSFSLAVHSRD